MKPLASVLLVTSFAASAFAQMDLSAMNTQTVKAGQPWASIETRIENLSLDVKIQQGVVTTVATLEYTPSQGRTTEYVCQPVLTCKVDTTDCVATSQRCETRTVRSLDLDSLETTVYFQQPDNTVLTDMYLWVGDAKVRAALQDRALASAQYEDIVKRRRDPALIETWGNGSYQLRIFPNESRKSRKIEIEFVQGMETAGSVFQTLLPVMQSLAKVPSDGSTPYDKLPNRVIENVRLTAVALDGKTYSLKWDGLGSGQVGATPLQLSAAKVEQLKPGTVSAASAACTGCLTPWTAGKAGVSYFGVRAKLTAKEMHFSEQPASRVVLLDVDTKDTLLASRARKVALLSLKAYAAAPYTGNLGLSDGKGGIRYLFPAPVSMDEANLRRAYEALVAWRPDSDADAHATLKAHARSLGSSPAPSVAYLVNNDTTAYFNWEYNVDGTLKTDYQAKYEAWEKARTAKEDETLAALKAANAILFGFWNDYRLNRVATATGGFQVGSLFGYIYYPYAGNLTTDVVAPEKPVDPLAGIHLPPLFGPGRPDAYQIVDLKVAASGPAIDHLVVLQDAIYNNIYLARPAMAVDMILPYPRQSPDSTTLRISGQYQGSGTATLTVTGLWGGLRFEEKLTVELPSNMGSGAAGAGIWAYQQGEAWGRAQVKYDVEAVKQLGKDYHIVNRQMSLLALEPGMDLWTEMPARDGSGGTTTARESNGAVPTSMKDSNGGFSGQTAAASLDKASLEDILNSTVGVKPPIAASGALGIGELALRRAAGAALLEWTLPGAGAEGATFRILDPNGRSLAVLPAVRTAQGFAATWQEPARKGLVLVVARSGSRTVVKKILLK